MKKLATSSLSIYRDLHGLHYGKVDTKHFKKVVTVANTVLEFDLLLVIKPLHSETFQKI